MKIMSVGIAVFFFMFCGSAFAESSVLSYKLVNNLPYPLHLTINQEQSAGVLHYTKEINSGSARIVQLTKQKNTIFFAKEMPFEVFNGNRHDYSCVFTINLHPLTLTPVISVLAMGDKVAESSDEKSGTTYFCTAHYAEMHHGSCRCN